MLAHSKVTVNVTQESGDLSNKTKNDPDSMNKIFIRNRKLSNDTIEQEKDEQQHAGLRKFGKWVVTPFYAIGSSVITTVAVSALPWLAGLALPILIPILAAAFLAEGAVAAYLFKDSVPETLIAVFGARNIFKGLSTKQKIVLGLGMFAALGGGLSLAALTYTSGVTAIAAVLGLCSVAFPPIGIAVAGVLAVVAFVALSSLFVKWIAHAIKTDIHKQVAEFFKKIFTRDPSISLAQQALEGFFKVFFTVSIVAITIVGTIATLGTMQKGLTAFLGLIPSANQLACQVAAGIIAFGLMGSARLPLVMQSVCTVFSKIGEFVGNSIYKAGAGLGLFPPVKPQPALVDAANIAAKPSENKKSGSWFSTIAKVSAVLLHGISFGALAKSGGAAVITDIVKETHISTTTSTAVDIGQTASMVSGGLMAGGIAGFTLFLPKPVPKAVQPEEDKTFEPAVPVVAPK